MGLGLASSNGMRLNPFNLSFSDNQSHLEKEFREDYYRKSLGPFRFAIIMAIIFYDIFALLDIMVVPQFTGILFIIRFGIITPLLIGVLLLSFLQSFQKFMQITIMTAWFFTGVGIILMNHIVSEVGVYSYYAGLVLIFIFGYTFIRARFVNALIVGWTLVIIYEIFAIWITVDIPANTLFNNNSFFISASVIGMFINYTQEFSFRRDFFMRKLLESEQEKVKIANESLEKRVKERTTQLTKSNIELNKEIERRRQYEEERNKLESQLLQLQKMETIGTLAGGIAHDFNNILTPILGYTEMAMEELEEESNLRYDIEQIHNAAIRAKDLVQQILTFSRQVEVDKRPIPLHQVIGEVLNLLKASFPANIEIIHDLDSNCGTVMADATQIHQVIMNLCTNAYHSMMDKGGTLKISLVIVEADNTMVRKIPKLEIGTYLCITIADTGHGMDSQTLSRIFEPFFTKKEVGVGSGLGLSVVHGIISSYDGAITVESNVGKGTIFKIYLPQHSADTDESKKNGSKIEKGKEHILFVDDEVEITYMGKRMLESIGYKVSIHTKSLTALEDFISNPKKYDLVVTDQTMPYMLGTDLIERMREFRPNIRAIIITGFGDSISEETAKDKGIDAVVIKPLILSNFSNLIRKVLDRKVTQKI